MSENVFFRNARKHSFTQVSNSLLNDSEVTLQAKGLLIIFLSNTEDWTIQMKEIITRSKNGRDAQYGILNELIKHGYVARIEYRDKTTKRFVKQEYIFSDNKIEVEQALEDVDGLAAENNLNAVISYKSSKSNKKKKPVTENQDTGKEQPKKPYPDIPDVEIPASESQYINNTTGNNTNSNNTNNNLNDMNNMNEDNTDNIQTNNSSNAGNHSENNGVKMNEDQYKKEMSFNKYPKMMYLQLQRIHFEDAKLLMDITNKAKKAVIKEYDDMKKESIDFSYEFHEDEISQVMSRMIMKAKYDNVSISHLSRFISRSVQNYYRDYAEQVLQEIIEKDMLNSNFKLSNK